MVILHLDDSDDLRELFMQYFSPKFSIYSAANVEEAIALVRSLPKIDLIVSDYFLERGTSVVFFDFLRREMKDIPAVLFSDSNLIEARQRIRYRYLKDIFDKNLETMESYLEAHATR